MESHAALIAEIADLKARAEALEKERDELRAQRDREFMRLAACGVAAICDTPTSMAEQLIESSNPNWSASYGDVLRRTKECIALRAALAASQERVRELESWCRRILGLQIRIEGGLTSAAAIASAVLFAGEALSPKPQEETDG